MKLKIIARCVAYSCWTFQITDYQIEYHWPWLWKQETWYRNECAKCKYNSKLNDIKMYFVFSFCFISLFRFETMKIKFKRTGFVFMWTINNCFFFCVCIFVLKSRLNIIVNSKRQLAATHFDWVIRNEVSKTRPVI